MKDKVFNKMREYGWNLGDNTDKEFSRVYNWHYDFIDKLFDNFCQCDTDLIPYDKIEINRQELCDMITFMSDFLRALNDIDKPKTKEDKIREYITSRNIQYDLVGEDLLAILDEEV